MRAGTSEQVRPELVLHRAAATVHEALLEAVDRTEFGNSAARLLIQDLLNQHGPSYTAVGHLFAARLDPPVCHGCDRADFTPTRDPVWPCHTYRRIAGSLENGGLFDSLLPPRATAVLVHLGDRRTPAGRGCAEARHRDPRPAALRPLSEGPPGIRLVRKEEAR